MEHIYERNSKGGFTFKGIVLGEGETSSKLIIPDVYKGLPVSDISISADYFSPDINLFTDIVIGNNVLTITDTTALFFRGENLERIYLGKSVRNCINLLNVSSNKIGGIVTDIYIHKDCSFVPSTTNSAGSIITHHRGILDIKYQVVGDYVNKTPISLIDGEIPDGSITPEKLDRKYATPEFVEDEIDKIAVSGGQVQADCLETDESKASFIKNKPKVDEEVTEDSENLITSGAVFKGIKENSYYKLCYDTRKFDDINISYTGDEVVANIESYHGLIFNPETNKYYKFMEYPSNIEDMFSELSSLVDSNDNEIEVSEDCVHSIDGISYIAEVASNAKCDLIFVPSAGLTFETAAHTLSFPESGIYAIRSIFSSGWHTLIKTIKFKSEIKKIENKFLYIDEEPAKDSTGLITSGAVYKVKEEVQNNETEIKDLKAKSEDAENQIKDLNEFKENTETSINKLEEAVEENESDIETLQTKVSEIQKKQCIVSVDSFPMEAKNNDIVALVNDTETSQIDKVVEVKTREELSTTDEDGTINVNLSGATLVKNIKIEGLPTDYDSLDGDIWSPYDFLENAESATIKVGIGIYDKLWKNGMKIIFTDTKFDALPHIEVVKVEDGIETSTYYYLFASIPLNEDNSLMIEESGWYKLVGDSYEKLSEDELSSVTQEFDEAYIVDYWTTENENEYNDAIEQGLNIKSPMAISVLISHFITLFVKKGLYKSDGSKWSEWALSSGTSNTENFATKDEVNSLLDSFAAMLDAANREVI